MQNAASVGGLIWLGHTEGRGVGFQFEFQFEFQIEFEFQFEFQFPPLRG